MHHPEQKPADVHPVRPWIVLTTTYDVEAWIDSYNRDLQQAVRKDVAQEGCGICLLLTPGGAIYMHTTSGGDILLDLTEEAEWVAPVITAATGASPPASSIWTLPGESLTQLILGLSGLIAATRIVVSHIYRANASRSRSD